MVSKTRLALPRCCTARSKKVGCFSRLGCMMLLILSPRHLFKSKKTFAEISFTVTDAVGTDEQYKFQYEAGDQWEAIDNRHFTLAAGPATQVLPVVYWNDTAP